MRQYFALALAVPVFISCTEAPSAPALGEPQVGFVSNPPPPPVGGATFTFLDGFGTSPLTEAVVAAQPGGNGGNFCADIAGFCFPSRFFQNTTDNNTWLDFVKTSNLPKGIAKQLGCSQSPGHVRVKNGVAEGQGCAWTQSGGLLLIIDLDEFDGLQGVLQSLRANGNGPALGADPNGEEDEVPTEGELQCVAVVGPGQIVGQLVVEGQVQPFPIANLVFAPGGEGNPGACAPEPEEEPEYDIF